VSIQFGNFLKKNVIKKELNLSYKNKKGDNLQFTLSEVRRYNATLCDINKRRSSVWLIGSDQVSRLELSLSPLMCLEDHHLEIQSSSAQIED